MLNQAVYEQKWADVAIQEGVDVCWFDFACEKIIALPHVNITWFFTLHKFFKFFAAELWFNPLIDFAIGRNFSPFSINSDSQINRSFPFFIFPGFFHIEVSDSFVFYDSLY